MRHVTPLTKQQDVPAKAIQVFYPAGVVITLFNTLLNRILEALKGPIESPNVEIPSGG